MLSKSLLILAVCAVAVPRASAFDFNYRQEPSASSWWGYNVKDTYDVAVLVKAPELVGKQITGLSVPLAAPDVKNVSAWLSASLNIKDQNGVKSNDPDVLTQDATVSDGVLNVEFSAPYTLTADGVYVGYSSQVSSLQAGDADKQPVAVYTGVNPDGFYLHTARHQKEWKEMSGELGLVSAMNVHVDATLPAGCMTIYEVSDTYAEHDQPFSIELMAQNHGTEPITSYTYTYAVGEAGGARP